MRNITKSLPNRITPKAPAKNKAEISAEEKKRQDILKVLIGALAFNGISVNLQAAEIMLLVVNAVNEKGTNFSFNDSVAIQEQITNKYGNS